MQYNDIREQLEEDERQAAYSLWQQLMFAPSSVSLEEARLKLKASSDRVQQAIMNAIVSEWAQNKSTPPEENPFGPLVAVDSPSPA